MMHYFGRLALAIAAPLLLSSCFLSPGKFTSKLIVNADRSFTFSYQGEVIALDIGDDFMKGAGGDSDKADDQENFDPPAPAEAEESDSNFRQIGWTRVADVKGKTGKADKSGDSAAEGGAADDDTAQKQADKDRKLRAVADALRKEYGYRSVEYVGKGKFVVDYQISGTLTHSFVFPFNIDAEAVFPFIALELRGADMVRMKAPAFGSESSGSEAMGSMGGGSSADTRKAIDGTFTLETDAEIVSQNNEDGAKTVAGRKVINWKVTPLTKDAPTVVLKFAK